jgi:tRNA nucleotidyltransferase/poly(A) polymerase
MLERDGGRYEIVTFRGPIAHGIEPEESSEGEEIENIEGDDAGEDQARQRPVQDLNQFGTAEQDALRRDFTINALFYDPDADELVDYIAGKQDVENRLVRTIGDPLVRMEEDPIRILRAIRHKVKLDLRYDPALEEAMCAKAQLLEQTSKDRIREEFLKVCNDRSLCNFLEEAKRLGLLTYFAPWFDTVKEEDWQVAATAWRYFYNLGFNDRDGPDLGIGLMMTPLVRPFVLDPYKEGLEPGTKNYLPDMKYFLSCEPLRNFFLRNLRVSRIQTDHVVRALFYWSRMTGLWLQNGPPRKIVGKLHHHPPAVLAGKMALITLKSQNANVEVPEWLDRLANYEKGRQPRGRHDRERRPDDLDDDSTEGQDGNASMNEQVEAVANPTARHGERNPDRQPREARPPRTERNDKPERRHREHRDYDSSPAVILPPPDKPLIWNGPLHAPVLRAVFNEEPAQRWARKNQAVRSYRPSGIPNHPVDHALLKANIVSNYKPEFETTSREEEHSHQPRSGRGRDRNDRQPPRGRAPRPDNVTTADANNDPLDESVRLMPNTESAQSADYENEDEIPSHLNRERDENVEQRDDDIDDNIGNRLDAPPTSGHIGVNGEGVLGSNRPPHHARGGHHPRGGGGGNRGARGGRKRRGGGGGGGGPQGGPRSRHGAPTNSR